MNERAAILEVSGVARAITRAADYLALAKPRVVAMVLVTTAAGFYLGETRQFNYLIAFHLLIGTAMAAGGTLALNQFIERDLDAKMERTRMRPLPDGRLRPAEALAFGIVTALAGFVYLWIEVNPLSSFITIAIAVLYLFAYTPLKRVNAICCAVGAIPGALPPVAGWAAARGSLGVESIVLFGMMFLWQMPHSLAIAQLYQHDYARAGIRLLPSGNRCWSSANLHIVTNSLALLAVGMLPTILGFAGVTYFLITVALGATLLICGIKLALAPKAAAARRVLVVSLVYLPTALLIMVLDKV